MRRTCIGLLVLSLLMAVVPGHSASAQAQTFHEHFDTTAHKDALYTTAHWDISSGLLKLPPTAPFAVQAVGWLSGAMTQFPAVYVPELGRAYLVGGTIDFHVPRSSAIREYDPARNVVEREMGARLPYERNSAAAAYAPTARRIYIFGGENTWTKFRDILEFDPFADTLTTLSVQLPHTLHHAAAVYAPTNNKIYIFGGLRAGDPSEDILEFDVATRTLRVLSDSLPTGRSDVCAAFVPETQRIYVFGGLIEGGLALDEILSFDPATGQATLLGPRLPHGLAKSTAAYVPESGRVLLFGGELQAGPWSKQVIGFQPSSGAVAPTSYALPGDGVKEAVVVYAVDSGWLALLGGNGRFGPWAAEQYGGIIRLRWEGSGLRQFDNWLPFGTHTSSAVYVPEQNKAYLFGGGTVHIQQFDIESSLTYTKTATLPVTSNDPGTVWVPNQQLAYIFDAAGGIYTYDPATDTLATKSQRLPSGVDPRVVAYATSRNAIYLFDSAEGSGAILRYNLADDSVTTLPMRLAPSRRGAYAVYMPSTDLIFVMGGYRYQDGGWTDEIWVFNVARETLEEYGSLLMPRPGEFKASLHLPTTQHIYLLGGYGGWSDVYAFPFENIWHFDTAFPRRIVEHTLTQRMQVGDQAALWNSVEDRFYAFGGFWKNAPDNMGSSKAIQRFDCGHTEHAVAQSTRINSDHGNVQRATLSAVQRLNGGSVEYLLSNDGGASWEAVTPGEEHVFSSQGCDLRWKAVLHGDGRRTPVVDELTIVYTPGTVSLLDPADGSHTCDHTPAFDWADVYGASSYRIQVDADDTFASPAIDQTTTSSNYAPAAALVAGEYYWRVSATTACGVGPWSEAWRFTIDTAPAVPASPSPADGATGVPPTTDLDWADASGATSYDVYFGNSPTPGFVTNVTVSEFNLATLIPYLDYYWQIVAKSACGNAPGPVWHFRTGAENQAPENINLWPDHGGRPAGRAVNFTATYRDRDGWRNLKQVFLHIGDTLAKRNACRLRYDVRQNKMYLMSNTGSGWLGGYAPGSATVIRNRQCTLRCAKSAVVPSGRLVRAKFNLVFRTGFRGQKNSYMQSVDMADAVDPWEQMGTWRVQ